MLYTMAEEKCREICLEIFNHLRKKDVFSKMFDWSKDQLPVGESMDDNKKVIDSRIADMVTTEIMSKMKRIEIESLSNFVKELFEWQQLAIGKECGELDRVFHGEKNVTFTFDEHKIESLFSLPKRSFTPEEKAVVVVSSPIWIPAVLLVGAVSISIYTPVYGVKKLMNRYENKKRIAQYNINKIQYANERAEKYLKTITFDNLLNQIQNGILKNIKERIDRYFSDVIPKRIKAGEMLIQNIERDMRPPCEIRKQCHKVEMEIMSVYGRIILAYTDIFEEKLIPLSDVRTSLTESLKLKIVSKAELRREEQWIPVHVSTITYAADYTKGYTELAELNIMRKCQHQNIVSLYGFSAGYGTPGKSFHVFTELCDRTFEDEILDGGNQSSKSRQRYLEDALKGVLYLHQNGIVHKNIRLGTILIKGNEAKLSSCGITKDIAKRTAEGFPIIRAPEFYKESYCGCEADVFQVGIVIWEAWYCKRAFFETEKTLETDDDLIKSIVGGLRPSFSKPLPQPPLIDVIKSCWKSDPNERPSAEIVLNELLKNFTNLQANVRVKIHKLHQF